MLNRTLDAFATRRGLAVTLGLLLSLWLSAGVYFQTGAKTVEDNQQLFTQKQLRNGFVAMSDIQRLTLLVQDAARTGTLSEPQRSALMQATDILYVRADTIRTVNAKTPQVAAGRASSVAAVAQMDEIIGITDAALSEEANDFHTLSAELIARAQAARGHLLDYLDEMRRFQDQILTEQTRAVQSQARVLWGILTALTVVGMTAVLLLRREVLARRARSRAEERVNFLAFFDPLTRLPNRVQYQDRLKEMLEQGTSLALLFVDLDEFKMINDTSGHAAGDAILCHVASVIRRLAERHKGFAARLGGDEFAVVVPTDDPEVLSIMCDEMISAARTPLPFEGESISASVSVGIATNTQVARDMRCIDMMARVTDFALYESKANGRGRFTFYDSQLERRFHERRAMLDALPGAIESKLLETFLQPKVTLPEARVYGFEALVRWRRDGVLIPPGEFILLAEESGLVTEIDMAVLSAATLALANWNLSHGTALSISVNLSAVHFGSPRIVDEVRTALSVSGLAPELLTLEITETAELRDRRLARAAIEALQNLGCRVSIDDFGAGFSSLAYLRAVRADELKIDKSLVDEITTSEEARFVFDAVMDLAESLRMDVVVEGIETEEQARAAHMLGARQAQGYWFGRPMPAAEALSATRTDQPPPSSQSDHAAAADLARVRSGGVASSDKAAAT